MQDLDRDVGVVGRDLAPALDAAFGRNPHEPDPLVGKGLDGFQFHGALPATRLSRPQRTATPLRQTRLAIELGRSA